MLQRSYIGSDGTMTVDFALVMTMPLRLFPPLKLLLPSPAIYIAIC
jgi:hypothetical protein